MKLQHKASEMGNEYNSLIFPPSSDKCKRSAWIDKTLLSKETNFPTYPFRIEHQHLLPPL